MVSETSPLTTVTLKELARSGHLRYSDGYRTRQDQLGPAGVPILRVADVQDGLLTPSYKDRVREEFRPQMADKLSNPLDVLVTTKGTVGRVARVPEGFPEHVYSPQVCFLRSQSHSVLDPRWLYYWTRSSTFSRQLQTYSGQTDMAPYLSLRDLGEFRLTLPPIAQQRRIASVLSSLDDIVDNNRRLVETLVQLVDAQFMLRFGLRELALEVAALAKVVDCLHSKKPERTESGRLCLQLNNIMDNGLLSLDNHYLISATDYARWTRNLETEEWDCIITNVGRVGAVARVPSGVAAALGRNMTAIRPIAPSRDGAFLLAALLSRPVRREIALKTDSGTILEALNVKSIGGLRLPKVTEEERQEFQVVAGPLLSHADSLLEETRQVCLIRDELLPLLLSGRVDVREVAA